MNKKHLSFLSVLTFYLSAHADQTAPQPAAGTSAQPQATVQPQEKPTTNPTMIVPSNPQRFVTHLLRGKPHPLTTTVAPIVAVTLVDKDNKKTTLESSNATIDAFFTTLEHAAHKIGNQTHQVAITYSHNGHEQQFSSTDEVPAQLALQGIQLYFYALRRASSYLGKTVKSPLVQERAKKLSMLTYLTLNPLP